jgi:murein DD-endopeptidase MepM/ murein hydrolase activator NlpD
LIPQACSDKVLCWPPYEDDGNEVRLYAQPSAYVDLTFALTVSTQGLVTDFAPALQVLKPGQRTLVAKYHRPTPGAAAHFQIDNARAQYGDYTVTSDSFVYGLPYRAGEAYTVGNAWNGFGAHTGDMAFAVDFLMPIGTPVLAARDGVVFATEASFSQGGNDPSLGSKANYVYIRHDNGTYGRYLHFKQGGVAVEVGQPVKRGQLIGYSGMVGWATAPHLHFDVATAKDVTTMRTLPAKLFLHANQPAGEEPKVNQTYTAF